MKKVHKYIFVLIAVLQGVSCGTINLSDKRNKKPEWVQQRPVNEKFYIGIGSCSKIFNPQDFQQVAKKNALNDLVGEIQVSVSTNSILSQYQNNQEFKQQFFADTKITAQAFVEDFQVLDSWQNEQDYWIYYRLSKSEYEAAKRKKLNKSVNSSLDFLERADKLTFQNNYMQIMRMRIKALAAVQNYLNENLETEYKGSRVYLVNEILNQLQDQLYLLNVKSNLNELKGKVGKPIQQPFLANVFLRDTSKGKLAVPFVPMTMKIEQGKMDFGNSTLSDQNGEASFSIARILSKDPVQQLRVLVDLESLSKTDSVTISLKKLILSLDAPGTNIRLMVDPIKVFVSSNEFNLDKKLAFNIIEPRLKKHLIEDGCNFVENRNDADYEIKINSNTKDMGVMFGKMLQSTIDMNISLIEIKNNLQIYSDALKEIRGFQTTPEKAGLNAYDEMLPLFWKNVFPTLRDELVIKKDQFIGIDIEK